MRDYLTALWRGADVENLKLTALINTYSLLRIPLLAFITPRVVERTGDRSVIQVRLDPRTRNHLGVMYFGALAMGAELSIALNAVHDIQRENLKVDFIFKDFNARFLRRADGHVRFVCDEGRAVSDLIRRAADSDERLHQTFAGRAYTIDNADEPIMTYELTLSVKRRRRAKA